MFKIRSSFEGDNYLEKSRALHFNVDHKCMILWLDLFRDVSSFPHGSIDKIGVQDKNMERNFVNANMYQPQPELDETASSVSEGNSCFLL